MKFGSSLSLLLSDMGAANTMAGNDADVEYLIWLLAGGLALDAIENNRMVKIGNTEDYYCKIQDFVLPGNDIPNKKVITIFLDFDTQASVIQTEGQIIPRSTSNFPLTALNW